MSALNRRLPHRWVATWLAVFGLVFVPTLSQAMAALGGGAAWVEVCSSQGSRWVPLPAEGATTWLAEQVADQIAAGQALLHQQAAHCPLCGVAAGGGLAPPPASAGLVNSLGATGQALPPQAQASWPGQAPCALPPPRAPPLPA